MIQNWPWAKQQIKKSLLNRSALYVISCSGLELKKVQTAASKHLVILPNIRGGGNDATFWVETASSAIIIVFLVYDVLWHVLWWFSGEPIY